MKAEMRTRHGEAVTPAFLRPGLVTWKIREDAALSPGGPLPVLAHVSGSSLGMAKTLEEFPEIAGRCGTMPDRIHVFPRVLPENGFTAEEWASIDARSGEVTSVLRESGLNLESSPPLHGDVVLDVILGEEGEALFVRWHRHDRFRFPFPGGVPRAILPDDAPSRAWLKMEQGLHYAGLGHPGNLAGKTALELGCAPGGGSFSLLTHGAKVVGRYGRHGWTRPCL